MTLPLRPRAGLAGCLAALVFAAACSTTTTGEPVAASGARTGSAASTISVPATISVLSTSAAPTATVTVTASAPTGTTPAPEPLPTEPPPTDTAPTDGPPGGADPATLLWVGTMCTQVTGVVLAVVAAPGADGSEPVDFRQEWSAYYAGLADTIIAATGEMAALEPPTVTDGAILHEDFLTYLKDLGVIAGTASIDVAEAPDELTAQTTALDAQARIAALSDGGGGLSRLEDPDLAAILRQTPECADLTG